jgi:hypothetical protein
MNSPEIEHLLKEGHAHQREGRYAAALAVYDRLLEADLASAAGWHGRRRPWPPRGANIPRSTPCSGRSVWTPTRPWRGRTPASCSLRWGATPRPSPPSRATSRSIPTPRTPGRGGANALVYL